jgi:hypothetical protein
MVRNPRSKEIMMNQLCDLGVSVPETNAGVIASSAAAPVRIAIEFLLENK